MGFIHITMCIAMIKPSSTCVISCFIQWFHIKQFWFQTCMPCFQLLMFYILHGNYKNTFNNILINENAWALTRPPATCPPCQYSCPEVVKRRQYVMPWRHMTSQLMSYVFTFQTHTFCVCFQWTTKTKNHQGPLNFSKNIVSLVHQEGAICTTKAQYAPWCTRETMFFEKFRGPWCGWYVAWVCMSVHHGAQWNCLSVCTSSGAYVHHFIGTCGVV